MDNTHWAGCHTVHPECEPHADYVAPDAERWRPERDLLAEKILLAWHTVEWYIGDATQKEWDMAYAAADAALGVRLPAGWLECSVCGLTGPPGSKPCDHFGDPHV